jgi:hypothetical protein
MTVEQFNKLMEDIRKGLERKLEKSKQMGILYPAVMTEVEEKFQLMDGASTEEILSMMREVIALAEHTGGTITHRTFETSHGRIGYYSHTCYYVLYSTLVDEVTDAMVKQVAQKVLRRKLGLSTWKYLDCKIFQLFREGKISWEDVAKLHKENCNI